MNIDSIEKEITDSIRGILKSKGIDESHFKIKSKMKTASAKSPVRPQVVGRGKEIVEWQKAIVTMVKMKLSVTFAVPDSD